MSQVFGMDDPAELEEGAFVFVKEHDMTPQEFIDELHASEKHIFEKLYAGRFAKKLYRMYEYRKEVEL